MQRNILKKVLVYSILLVLAFIPKNHLYAAQDSVETSADLDDSISGTYYVNAQHGLKMRDAPSTDADVVALLPYKAELTVKGAVTDNWYQVEYSNQSGYAAAAYLTKSTASSTTPEDTDTNATETETQESTLSLEEARSDTFGTSSVITALIAAIIIMVILAIGTAYSFLRKGNNEKNAEYDDDEDEDDNDNVPEYNNEAEYNDDEYGDYDEDE